VARNLPKLGPLEEAVLAHLWEAGESDVATAHAAVGAPRGIAANTVGSALERLHRKGLAGRWKLSHAYRYRAALGRDELTVRRVIEAAGGGSALGAPGLLAAFVDVLADTDAATLERLEKLIEAKRAERES
jgi:BlaI family transcriptional regulator, penicillinase repressor